MPVVAEGKSGCVRSEVGQDCERPVIRRGATGTLSTEVGQSTFYSKKSIRSVASESCSTLNSLASDSHQRTCSALQCLESGRCSSDNGSISRFPKLQECAHFHYDRVDLGKIEITVYQHTLPVTQDSSNWTDLLDPPVSLHHICPHSYCGLQDGDYFMTLLVKSKGRSWLVRRTYEDFRKFDRLLHKCVYDRKFSQLCKLIKLDCASYPLAQLESLKEDLSKYLLRFCQLAGNLINCAPVLSWLELDNRGNRLIALDESDINIPAVAAVHVFKRYVPQAGDELPLEVGDMISVIDMSTGSGSGSEEDAAYGGWWRGKKQLEVGYFPSDCVQVIATAGNQASPLAEVVSSRLSSEQDTPGLRRKGKVADFFRSFLTARPTRRRLKETGILKERVFGCDLGEYLMNASSLETGMKVPGVLIQCATFIEEHGLVDGIYRLSGVTSNIQKLRQEFDADVVPDLNQECYAQDIHSVASVLKLYFRELPVPLLTFQLYGQFVRAVQASEETRLLKIHDVVSQLPPPHYRTVEYLMRHLARVASVSDRTGMNCKNLAIVWAPNLLRSSECESGVEALKGVSVCAIAVEYLVKYAELIFSNRMQTASLLSRSGGSARHNRPKSLAVSSPTKLLSVDQAQALPFPRLPLDVRQNFLQVGPGPDHLPQYHTVIDLPRNRGKRRSSSVKAGHKSPSSWRSMFAATVQRRRQVWPQRSPLLQSTSCNSVASVPQPSKIRSSQSRSAESLLLPDPGLADQLEPLRRRASTRSAHSTPPARHLHNKEPHVMRTPVDCRRSHPGPGPGEALVDTRRPSLPLQLEMTSPKRLIDVVRTVPYGRSESGVLVKLFMKEEAGPETAVNGMNSKKRTRLVGVPTEIHHTQPRLSYKKLHRTLSPKFLRKQWKEDKTMERKPYEKRSVGIKRSLSVSPKLVHYSRVDVARMSVKSSASLQTQFGHSSVYSHSSSESSGRKSFRRSTSDELLDGSVVGVGGVEQVISPGSSWWSDVQVVSSVIHHVQVHHSAATPLDLSCDPFCVEEGADCVDDVDHGRSESFQDAVPCSCFYPQLQSACVDDHKDEDCAEDCHSQHSDRVSETGLRSRQTLVSPDVDIAQLFRRTPSLAAHLDRTSPFSSCGDLTLLFSQASDSDDHNQQQGQPAAEAEAEAEPESDSAFARCSSARLKFFFGTDPLALSFSPPSSPLPLPLPIDIEDQSPGQVSSSGLYYFGMDQISLSPLDRDLVPDSAHVVPVISPTAPFDTWHNFHPDDRLHQQAPVHSISVLVPAAEMLEPGEGQPESVDGICSAESESALSLIFVNTSPDFPFVDDLIPDDTYSSAEDKVVTPLVEDRNVCDDDLDPLPSTNLLRDEHQTEGIQPEDEDEASQATVCTSVVQLRSRFETGSVGRSNETEHTSPLLSPESEHSSPLVRNSQRKSLKEKLQALGDEYDSEVSTSFPLRQIQSTCRQVPGSGEEASCAFHFERGPSGWVRKPKIADKPDHKKLTPSSSLSGSVKVKETPGASVEQMVALFKAESASSGNHDKGDAVSLTSVSSEEYSAGGGGGAGGGKISKVLQMRKMYEASQSDAKRSVKSSSLIHPPTSPLASSSQYVSSV